MSNIYSDERKIGCKVSFQMLDLNTHRANFTFAYQSINPIMSQTEQVIDGITVMTKKYATIEQNRGWMLDGTYGFISQEQKTAMETGYWSLTATNSAKNFTTPQYLTITSDVVLFSRVITIVFDQNTLVYPTSFTVKTYDSGGTLINTSTITNNASPICVVEMPDSGYNSVKITATTMNQAYRQLRITEVLFGEISVLDDDELQEVRLTYETSIFGDSLPSNCMEIEINNVDDKYTINNPYGVYKYLQQGQSVNVVISVNGASYNMGLFYFAEAKSEANDATARIIAYDALYELDNIPIDIGGFGVWTVADAVRRIILISGMDIKYNLPDEIGSRQITKWIPVGTTARECLRLIAQAGRCICYFDKINTLQFYEPKMLEPTDYLDYDRVSAFPAITDTGLINYVEISVRNDFEAAAEDIVYSATDRTGTEPVRALNVVNPLVYDGQAVARWILQMAKMRMLYECAERGNPLRNLQDTITVYDAFGGLNDCIVISQEYDLETGLKGVVKAVSE